MIETASLSRSRRRSAFRAVAGLLALGATLLLGSGAPVLAQGPSATTGAAPADIGWPRQLKSGSDTITVYQPQVDGWDGNLLKERAAVSVATPASPAPIFGVVWFSARTDVDKQTRMVTLHDIDVSRVSFPTRRDEESAILEALRDAVPQGAATIALDRLEANLQYTRATEGAARRVEVKNTPPRIIVSEKPAILVLVDGKPVLRQVEGSESLLRVINTRALLLFDQSSGTYYLYTMNRWAGAYSLDGPWSTVASPPAALAAAKDAAARTGDVDLLSDPPGKAKSELEAGVLPELYVATGPAELLQTSGPPQYQPIAGTQLLDVTNTSSDIFMDTSTQTYYVLVSGRWFSSSSLTQGPWDFVPADRLPADFASIPFNHPKGAVLASVASTPQAEEATISASVPQTATVKRSEATMPAPQYDGAPKFADVEGTSLQYAVNTATPVIESAPGQYYAVVNGLWFRSASPSGPWVVADAVPPAIYTIPPSSPIYYVTYVRVYGATPDVVYVGYTPGYYGTYVVPTGTVVYGTGYVYTPWVGTVWIGPPYTYGFGAGFAFGAATGFALGYAAGAFCHPWWGPAGWGYGWGWGWGGGTVNVNRTFNVNHANVYDRWGHGSVVQSGDRYAGHVGNTTFAGKGNDVYADRNGNVYRRQNGSWQKYDDGSWNDVSRQQAEQRAHGAAGRTATGQVEDLTNLGARGQQHAAAGGQGSGQVEDLTNLGQRAQQPAGAGAERRGDLGGGGTTLGGAGSAGDVGTLGEAGTAGRGGTLGDVGTLGGGGTIGGGAWAGREQLEALDRDWQARQLGDQRWNDFRQGGGYAGDRERFGGERPGGGDLGGDRFGGGFRGGFGGGSGGFHGGRR